MMVVGGCGVGGKSILTLFENGFIFAITMTEVEPHLNRNDVNRESEVVVRDGRHER